MRNRYLSFAAACGAAFVTSTTPALAGDGVKTAGEILRIALPVAAGGFSLYKQDYDGVLQLTVSEVFTEGTSLVLQHFIKEQRPDKSDWHSFRRIRRRSRSRRQAICRSVMAGITVFRPMPLRRSSAIRASKRKSIIGATSWRARCWDGARAKSPPSAIAILRSPPRRALAIRRSAFRCRRTGKRSPALAHSAPSGLLRWPPLPSFWPPGSTADMNCPPREPSLSGWMVTETLSPAFTESGFQPTRACCAGEPISIAHCSGLAAWIVDHDAQPAMRIGPFEFLDGPGHGDGLVGIEHGKGMMREGRRRERAERHCGQAHSFQVHRTSSIPAGDRRFGREGAPSAYPPPVRCGRICARPRIRRRDTCRRASRPSGDGC